jgi:hypothetical protein
VGCADAHFRRRWDALSQIVNPSLSLETVQFLGELALVGMSIAEQHSYVPVAADRRDFRHGKTLLEKSADSLVSQIVKMQIFNLCSFREPIPCKAKRNRRYWKDALIAGFGIVAHHCNSRFENGHCQR